MTRIALVSSEPIRPRMAGIGIRYLEFARRLAAAGLETVLLSPAALDAQGPAQLPADHGDHGDRERAPASADDAGLDLAGLDPAGLDLAGVELQRCGRQGLAGRLAGCDAVVAQGQLANDVVLAAPELPAALDLYDPWMVENLAYHGTLGLDPYRNDHATWLLQLSRGDFFLCSSEEQRVFYLGFLTAVGRVNPELVARDPDLRSLIDVVPFGVPEELPPHRPYLAPRRPGETRLLFGGLYDWYDPWTLLEALAALDRPGWELLLIHNPNPGTPQGLFAEVEARCRRLGWWGERVRALDWVPVERRYDLLRDVDVLVAPHRPSLETRLSLRTRFLDALAAGCPVVTTEGGAMSRLLREHRAGWVVPPGDAVALARALREVLDAAPASGRMGASAGEPSMAAAWRQGAAALLASFRWEQALQPLLRFCREPRRDATKERFVHSLATAAPPDGAVFRLRRRLRRLLGALPPRPAKPAKPPMAAKPAGLPEAAKPAGMPAAAAPNVPERPGAPGTITGRRRQ
jgi:glycosyltransferase involved in cell wall biosynthesis